MNAVLRHAGGVRIDHIIGLFRLWWIPKGSAPTEGTYVRYDHEAMIGIVALEAHRAEAVVVGEDLGTVQPWVRDYLRERGLFGTSILWFEADRDGPDFTGGPLPAERWREFCLSSVTTHDLPPTAGYLAGEHVRLRDQLGLLTRPAAEELASDQEQQAAWLAELRRVGLLGVDTKGTAVDARSRAVPVSRPYAVQTAHVVADRRRRGPTDPKSAGHHRRIPELAGSADWPRRPQTAARGRFHGRPGRRTRRGDEPQRPPAGVTPEALSPVSHLSPLRYVRTAPT